MTDKSSILEAVAKPIRQLPAEHTADTTLQAVEKPWTLDPLRSRQLREQLVRASAVYADKPAVQGRIRLLKGQLHVLDYADPDAAERIRGHVERTLNELEQVLRDGGEYIHAHHGRG